MKGGPHIVTEPRSTSAALAATATHTLTGDTATTDTSMRTTEVDGKSVRLIRRLVGINLAFVALQPISAGLFLSGYGRAVMLHAAVAFALVLGALVQGVTGVVLWRRHRVPAWIAGVSIGFFVAVFVQHGLGYQKVFWLHLPIGVGLFGWLIRLHIKLEALGRTTGTRS
jgi:hypothetical protein